MIKTNRIEVNNTGGSKTIRNRLSGDDRTDRMTVAHRFRNCYDVGHYVVSLERPVVRAATPKTDLHFVRNAHAAGISNMSAETW